MDNLFNQLSTILSAGIGGLAFFGAWVYLIWGWLGSQDFVSGQGNLLGWLPW